MGRRVVLRLLACLIVLLPVAGRADVTYPMAAVGVLGSREVGGCSAALIEPDIVLTAAHCVDKNRQDGRNLVFRTGAYPGVPRVETPVAGIAFHPLYSLNLKPATTRIRFDLAVVRLARPVDAPGIEPLRLGPAPQPGELLLLASYRGGLGERARERRCEVFPGPPDLAALGCEVKGGESGAPVIRTGPDGLEIAAVMSSQSRFDKQPIGFAPPVLPRIGPVFELLPEAPPAPPAGQTAPVEVTDSP